MPRALKACGSCGTPTPESTCPQCHPDTGRPRSGHHLDPTAKLLRTRRWRALAAHAIHRQPWCAWPGGCDHAITDANPLTGDHDIPRTRAPERVYDETNVVVLCRKHNSEKGTRTLDEVRRDLTRRRR